MTDNDRSGLNSAEERPQRERAFNIPPIVVAAIVACVGIQVLRDYVLNDHQDIQLLIWTAFIPIRYTREYFDFYAVTSPITYSFLHGSFTHLIVNMIWLAAFGAPLATRFGAWRFCLFWAVSSGAAAALHFATHPFDDMPLVGASGAISGMMGAAARFAFHIDRSGSMPSFAGPVLPALQVLRVRSVLVFLTVWLLLNFVTGFYSLVPSMESPIAWEAHIGGFLVGFFGISFFDPGWPGRAARPPAPEEQSEA